MEQQKVTPVNVIGLKLFCLNHGSAVKLFQNGTIQLNQKVRDGGSSF